MTEEIESTFPQGHFSWDDRKPTDVASILKYFLRCVFIFFVHLCVCLCGHTWCVHVSVYLCVIV